MSQWGRSYLAHKYTTIKKANGDNKRADNSVPIGPHWPIDQQLIKLNKYLTQLQLYGMKSSAMMSVQKLLEFFLEVTYGYWKSD